MKKLRMIQIREFKDIEEEGRAIISAAESLNSWSYDVRDSIEIIRVHPLWVNGSGAGGMMYVAEYKYR